VTHAIDLRKWFDGFASPVVTIWHKCQAVGFSSILYTVGAVYEVCDFQSIALVPIVYTVHHTISISRAPVTD